MLSHFLVIFSRIWFLKWYKICLKIRDDIVIRLTQRRIPDPAICQKIPPV